MLTTLDALYILFIRNTLADVSSPIFGSLKICFKTLHFLADVILMVRDTCIDHLVINEPTQ
ncbi:hypothetical protein PR003_g23863 [Phytophthora rubi]|uniref:Uncharacterized protein n=1 Tax=Phytophthora rubi TaxID=129364 RepID=A0A6A3L9U6_9STRA|nr:hypothetical protein PR001_g14819 [Phytophthora rubi]KAE9018643.1 hypothetical protein PR002_g13047 [Phytophthora rubi]KAE9295990.1 hypothetical protein PR003_g23863 [Phytophthora rubi]